jgi:hypothetical protein
MGLGLNPISRDALSKITQIIIIKIISGKNLCTDIVLYCESTVPHVAILFVKADIAHLIPGHGQKGL